jgi:hypothetical protein
VLADVPGQPSCFALATEDAATVANLYGHDAELLLIVFNEVGGVL